MGRSLLTVTQEAQKDKDKIIDQLKQEATDKIRKQKQAAYPTKQKQMNKQIFGDLEDKRQVTSVLNTETVDMVTDPEEVVQFVQHARPVYSVCGLQRSIQCNRP